MVWSQSFAKLGGRYREGVNDILQESKKRSERLKSLEEFDTFLKENPEHLHYKDDRSEIVALERILVESPSQKKHMILVDRQLLEEFTTHDVFTDSTFKSCPNIAGVTQLMTLMGEKNNMVSK